MTRTLRSVALAALALLALTAAAPAAPTPKTQAPSTEARKVRVVMNLVRTQFLEPVADANMVGGALEGLKKALQERKREVGFLGASAKDAASVAQFDRAFADAASRNPDLLGNGTLTRAAIDGVVSVLEDPHTSFLSSSEYRKLLEGLGGSSFGGIGVFISADEKTGALTCVEAMEDGPAAKAGVKSRDVITAIDGVPVTDITLEDAKERLRGEPGSTVSLTLRREGSPEPVQVKVVRDIVKVKSVTSRVESAAGRKVGYVRVRMFGTGTGSEFAAALDELGKQGVEGYVLDLRNNGGGYIVAAVDLLSQFVPASTPVVSVAERGQAERVYRSRGSQRAALPLVVLVNDHSASASEITAGAIQDLKIGTLVGVHTYGKGSVQKIIPLADLSALKLTTAHYRTPSGRDIHKKGIEPDVVVEMPAQDIGTPQDVQLARALQVLEEKLR